MVDFICIGSVELRGTRSMQTLRNIKYSPSDGFESIPFQSAYYKPYNIELLAGYSLKVKCTIPYVYKFYCVVVSALVCGSKGCGFESYCSGVFFGQDLTGSLQHLAHGPIYIKILSFLKLPKTGILYLHMSHQTHHFKNLKDTWIKIKSKYLNIFIT